MLLIDDRIGSKELHGQFHMPTTLTRLEYGDISFTGNGPDGPAAIGIERKKIHDLISSIESGRLSGHQLIGLVNTYNYIYLIVEGLWKLNREGLICTFRGSAFQPVKHGSRIYTGREIYNYLNTLAIKADIVILRTTDESETVFVTTWLYNWWDKEWDDHKSHLQFHRIRDKVFLSPPSTLLKMVKELDGVGWEKSQEMVKHFDTLEKLMSATTKELREVDGIGKKLAASVYYQLHGRDEQ